MSESTNPYSSPLEGSDDIPRNATNHDRRFYVSRLAIGGLMGGFLIGSLGYVLLTVALDTLLTPPFVKPANYGQFFFVVFAVTLYMSMFGLALGLVPIITWKGYLPINMLGVLGIILFDTQFFAEVSWLEAPIAAMLILFAFPSVAAIIADRWIGVINGAG